MNTLLAASPPTTDVVGGYRLLRKIGDGENASVFVGFGIDGTRAAVKVYRFTARAGSAEREIEALWRAEGEHIVSLIDVAPTAIILERLEWGPLDDLLHRRQLTLAEVVTVLAPIATVVDHLHVTGVAHGSIGSAAILFREGGVPVLARFGSATLFEAQLSVHGQSLEPSIRRDRVDLASLARNLLSATNDSRCDSLIEWCMSVIDSDGPDPVGRELAEQLFRLEHPAPIIFEPDVADSAIADYSALRPAPRSRLRSSLRAPGPFAWLPSRIEQSRAWCASLFSGVRRSLWVALGAVVAALLAAVIITTAMDRVAPAKAVGDGGSSEQGSTGARVEREPGVGAQGRDEASEMPVRDAVEKLLSKRSECLRDLSLTCLRSVHQTGSSALSIDSRRVRSVREGGESSELVELDTNGVVVVEESADSAVVKVGGETHSASLLVVKGEAGWRIKSYFVD